MFIIIIHLLFKSDTQLISWHILLKSIEITKYHFSTQNKKLFGIFLVMMFVRGEELLKFLIQNFK